MKKILHVLVIVFCVGACGGAPIQGHVNPLLTGIEHTGDFKQLFGSSKVTDEVFGIVTRFMDTEAKADFLHLFEESKAGLNGFDHRAMGHVLDGGYIRKEAIERIIEKCPGLTREEVLRRLVKYNKDSLDKLVRIVHETYGLPVREAKALIRIDACTHLLGDTTSVKTIGQIPTLKRIISTYERNLSKFIGKQQAAQIAKQLRKVVAENKTLNNKELYKLVKKTIEESGVGEKLQRAIAKLTKNAAEQQANSAAKSGWWNALKTKIPANIWAKIGKSKIAKSTAKWAKMIAKSSTSKKIVKAIKPVAKAVPYVVDFAFWGYDMYSTSEEYATGEIAKAERDKKYAEGTGKAVGAAGGVYAGAKAGDYVAEQINFDNPWVNLAAKLIVKFGGAAAGGVAGAKAGGAAAGAGYDATLGSPFEQAKKDAGTGNPEAKFFLGKYYDEGRYVKRDFKKAVEEWNSAATMGHARAAYEMGRCYMIGKGVDADYEKAVEFLWKGYVGGYDKSALPLARAYYEGVGVPRSPRTAIMLLKSAVDQNVEGAREYAEELLANAYGSESECDYQDPYVVAQFFYTGLIVDADKQSAINLLEIASENGDPLATCMLGDVAVESQMYSLAQSFYEDAADEGFHEAQVKLAYLIDRGEAAEDDYDKDIVEPLLCEASDLVWDELNEIQDVNGELACWLRGRSRAGSIYSTVVLARMVMSEMSPPDVQAAEELLQGVVGKGCCVADRRYARLLLQKSDEASAAVAILDKAVIAKDAKSRFWRVNAYQQLGREEDAERELRAYVDDEKNVSDLEYAIACSRVGNGYLGDDKNVHSHSDGEQLLVRAAELGYSHAQYLLGIRYLYGLNLGCDVQKGLEYLHTAAQDNHVLALYHLGECYSTGIGLDRDIECAKYYYRRSAELGSSDAQYKYAVLIKDSENNEAMMWCENAAQNGNMDACAFMGDYYLNAEEDETHMGFEGRAFDYYSKGAAAHNYECLIGKGNCLMKGKGCKKNPVDAEKCYKEARSIYAKDLFARFSEEVKKAGLTTEDFIIAKFGSIRNDSDYYARPKIDLKKLRKGMKAMKVNVDENQIIAQYDATVLGGAKEGMLLSAQGVYFSNGTPLFCAWKDIQRVEVVDSYNIHIVGSCRHQITGEKYRGGYVKIYGGGDDGIVRQGIATVLEVAAAINGGCGHSVGEYASANDGETFARYCCWAFSQSELANANNVVIIEPGESLKEDYLAKILNCAQDVFNRLVPIDGLRIWIDESAEGRCDAGVIITDDEFYYFKDGNGVNFKLVDIASVDWERNSGGCIYINGTKCNFLVNNRKPFVDIFKKVLSRIPLKRRPTNGCYEVRSGLSGTYDVYKDGAYTGFTSTDRDYCNEWINEQRQRP